MRLKHLLSVFLTLLTLSVGQMWGENFSETYSYSDKGTTWDLTNCEDKSKDSYWLCPTGDDPSIASISGIFTGKTITSAVTITINHGTFGNGDNPTESTFEIYNSSACSSKITATKSGTLATSKTYTNVVYTVSASNAASGFTNDLAIKITKPGRQIRLNTITVAFSYTTASSCSNTPTMSFTPNSIEKTEGDDPFTKEVTISGQGGSQTVAYSSSNTNVATVNTSTGEVTIKTNGSTTITASVSESGNYCSASASYTLTVNKPTHKVYFYNGTTLLNDGGTSIEEDAAVTYSGSTPVSCDDGEGASSTFVGWATNTWTNKKTAKGDIPAGTTFYDVTASESLPNMSTDDVTYHAVFAKGTEVSTPVANTWTRITNVSQLTDGATVMLVQYYADKAINNTPGATNCTANAEITNSTTNLRWIAEKSGNKWKFKTSGGSYLSTNSLADQTALSLNATYNEWSITEDASYSNCFNLNNGNDLEYYSSFKVYAYSSKYASAYPFYIYIQKTTTSTTYSNYMTTCCSPLGSINGSLFWTTHFYPVWPEKHRLKGYYTNLGITSVLYRIPHHLIYTTYISRDFE